MRSVIVEDDAMSVLALRKCIDRLGGIEVDHIFSNGTEALKQLNEEPCELLFLDIEIEGLNGMELMRSINSSPRVIIISSKSEYAAEAYDFDVVDYIVKPINYDRFCRAIAKVKKMDENIKDETEDYFYLKNNGRFSQIFYKDIVFVEALADFVTIHTESGKKYTILSTMKAIEAKLPTKDFMRVHRSFIIRLEKIKEIEENQAMIAGKAIPVSRNNYDELMKRIKLF